MIYGNAAMVESSLRGLDKNDGLNVSQKHMNENQSIHFDQSLPIKYEEEAAIIDEKMEPPDQRSKFQ